MRILGVDPGSRFVGFGVIEVKGPACHCVDYGVLRAVHLNTLDARLLYIFEALQGLMNKHKPDAVAIEDVFFGKQKSPRGILLLGQARGVALLAAALGKAPIFSYAPARIKKAVGAGGGNKAAVTRMIKILLELPAESMKADAYDGLAIALCHAHTVRQVASGSSASEVWVARPPARPSGPPARPLARPGASFAARLSSSYVGPGGGR